LCTRDEISVKVTGMKQFTLSRNSDGEWTVTCAKVPGLVIKAETRHEAIEKMKNAVKLYFPCGDCKGSSQTSR
jgi:hypothetical protein